MRRKSYLLIFWLSFAFLLQNCVTYTPCVSEDAAESDSGGEEEGNEEAVESQTKTTLIFFIPRSPNKHDQVRMLHCYNGRIVRGMPWWKMQNPKIGQKVKTKEDPASKKQFFKPKKKNWNYLDKLQNPEKYEYDSEDKEEEKNNSEQGDPPVSNNEPQASENENPPDNNTDDGGF